MSEIALERIKLLFDKAEERKNEGRDDLADRYVELALKISEKAQTPIPNDLKKKFCSECVSFLLHGENCRTRINPNSQKIIYRCLECGAVSRYEPKKK